ncbi:MAG: hypothetical protein L0H79_13105 [Intrasporangium sp.]|nr:hypothetical protein [Intrasporangium sp.]MDN5796677.1 hypothetical protein [Intrasporangium sp.]
MPTRRMPLSARPSRPAGARRPERVADNVRAGGLWEPSAEDLAALDEITA